MEDVNTGLFSTYFSIPSLISGVIIGLIVAFILLLFNKILLFVSRKWKYRTEFRKREREKKIQNLVENPDKIFFIAYDELSMNIKMIVLLIMGFAFTIFGYLVIVLRNFNISNVINDASTNLIGNKIGIIGIIMMILGVFTILSSLVLHYSVIDSNDTLLEVRKRIEEASKNTQVQE